MGVEHKKALVVVMIDRTDFTIAAGAAGWIDTDITSVVPANAKAVFANAWTSAGTGLGMRAAGDTVDPSNLNWSNSYLLSEVVFGHVELLRQAAGNNHYEIIAYLR